MMKVAERGNFEHCWVEGHGWHPTDAKFHGLPATFDMSEIS